MTAFRRITMAAEQAPVANMGQPERIISCRMSIAELVVQAAIRGQIRPADIYGSSTLRIHAWPRQWVMLEARRLGHSLPVIGRELGLHHTTVMHGIAAEAERRAVQG